ncbi:MAG: radical SAM protein, partial [Flavobacterium sp.]|uniref:B12-binding domain-containing radical SAM protein n=1 Tax=Flavobacterium sp. TaxID=239 RepID=UPI00345CFD82|nr:radical SAM protein [Flavobacterium sp.]
MSKILFSHSYYYKLDPKQWKNKTPFPPLGTLYAASLMRKNNYEVSLFDTNLLDSPKSIEPVLEKKRPDFLVIYDDGFNYLTKMCLTKMREACFEMIKIGKKNNCTTIICSSDSTDHYKEYLEKGADFIIQGEGEWTLLELINVIENQKDIAEIQGIVYKNKNEINITPKRDVLNELDKLPLPAWDLVDMES